MFGDHSFFSSLGLSCRALRFGDHCSFYSLLGLSLDGLMFGDRSPSCLVLSWGLGSLGPSRFALGLGTDR
jgi:hypothetical protein